MQFLVPQFIDVEDKIVGPLTLRQFIYIAGGMGASLLLFFILQLWLWFILSIFIMATAIALALVKINGQPLVKIVLSAIGFYWRPQTYVWQEKEKRQESKPAAASPEKNISLENIVSGFALRKSWQNLQTGSKLPNIVHWGSKRGEERYEIVKKITGDRQAARRIDYR